MSGISKSASTELLSSPSQLSGPVSPSADSRANGTKHSTTDVETAFLPSSPKSSLSSVDVSESSRGTELTHLSPGDIPSFILSDDVEGETKPEPIYVPAFIKKTDAILFKSDIVKNGNKTQSEDIPSSGTKSPIDHFSNANDDSDSDDSDLEFVYQLVEDAMKTTSLEQVLAKLDAKIKAQDTYNDDGDSDDSYFEEDEYMYEIDENSDRQWDLKYRDVNSDALKALHNMCWRILDNARRCHASQEKLPKAKGQRTIRKLERIVKRMAIIDDDLNDIAIQAVPVQDNMSKIPNLTTLLQHLTAKGDVTVKIQQVINEINAGKIWSHFQGFMHYRKEDLQSLLDWKVKVEDVMDRWEALRPYMQVYCEETEPLSQICDKWIGIIMPESELRVWTSGMQELVQAASKLVVYFDVLIKDFKSTIRGYSGVSKVLRNNLIGFLDLDISSMFMNNETPSEKEYLFD